MTTMLLATLALAAPPVPTWNAADVEPADPQEDVEPPATPEDAPMGPAVAPLRGAPAVFETGPDAGHGWANVEDLSFDLSGEVGRFYYVMATARGGGLVAHWRQGPIAGEDLTTTHDLEVPEELTELVALAGLVHLSLTAVTVDERDRERGRTRLAKTWVRAVGSTLVGGQPGPPVEHAPNDEVE